ncbi:MAG: cell division protein FtsZ [Patescibacteria group bacterium]
MKKGVRSKRNKASIKVVGIGGGGGNAVTRMKEGFVRGIEFIAINTDTQDLDYCNVHRRLHIGRAVTRGLGTGMNPELGRQAAEENKTEIAEVLSGADLVFITAGLGGGTGSGASPIVADIAREVGALVVAVVTKPFTFEGGQRAQIADDAFNKLRERVDTHIVVPNDKIFEIIGNDTSITKAFSAIDDVLRGAVQGIAELIAMPGIINVDFADVKTIMQSSGSALVGVGVSSGRQRAASAVNQILTSPLLETSLEGARGLLFGVSGGRDLKMAEINEVAKIITANVDSSAKIIFGAYHDRKLAKGKIRITLVATGFGVEGLPQNISNGAELKTSSLFGEEENGSASSQTRLPQKPINGPQNEQISSNRARAYTEVESKKLKIESKNNKEDDIRKDKSASTKATADEERKTNSNSKSPDMWDIPAFLRRKKN